jgi:hypothetical protein
MPIFSEGVETAPFPDDQVIGEFDADNRPGSPENVGHIHICF